MKLLNIGKSTSTIYGFTNRSHLPKTYAKYPKRVRRGQTISRPDLAIYLIMTGDSFGQGFVTGEKEACLAQPPVIVHGPQRGNEATRLGRQKNWEKSNENDLSQQEYYLDYEFPIKV